MKPSLIFYNNGNYTGTHYGDVEINGKVDVYNSYMDKLMRPDCYLFKFNLSPPLYGGWRNDHNKMYNKLLIEMVDNSQLNKAP